MGNRSNSQTDNLTGFCNTFLRVPETCLSPMQKSGEFFFVETRGMPFGEASCLSLLILRLDKPGFSQKPGL